MKSFGPVLAPLALLFSKGSSLVVENTPPEDSDSIRSFRQGPFGLGSGVIISSGNAVDAVQGGFANNALECSGSMFCGEGSTFDAAVYTVDFLSRPGFNGVQIEFVVGSADSTRESDPIAIWLNGDQYAIDSSGQQITARSEFLNEPIGIGRPQNGLQYGRASPSLLFGIPTRPGINTLVFAACDLNDDVLDTGLLFNIKGCVDCDTNIKINYVTTTVTVGAAEETGAPETIKASGQARGTVIVTVQETAVTTTTEAVMTTTAEAPTTTTEAAVTTSEAAIITSTADPTTSGTVETSAASSNIVTEDTTAQTTTAEAGPVTTADTTEAMTSSIVVTDASAQTTTAEAEPTTTSEAITSDTAETTTAVAVDTTTALAVDTTTADVNTEATTEAEPATASEATTTSDSATLDITTSSIIESIATTSAEAANTQTSAIGTTDVVSSDETETATLSTEVKTVSQSINPSTTTESSPVQDTATATGTDSPSSIETASASTSRATSEGSTGTSTGFASQLSSAVIILNSQTTDVSTLSTSAKRTSTADSSLTSTKTDASAPLTSVTETISDHIATPYPTAGNSHIKGYNVTKTEPATTVTTVVYTTVNPHKPDCLTTTEIAVTVGYTPCNCAHQTLPPVDMTTVVVPCQSCGPHGENSISLTVPAAACETGSKTFQRYILPGPNEQPKPQPTYKQLIQTMSAGDHGETEDHSAYQKNGQPSALPHKDYPTSNDKYPVHPTQAHGNYSTIHTETPKQPAQHYPNGQGQGGFSKTHITQAFTVAAKAKGTNSTTLHTGVPSYEPNAPIAAAGGIKFGSGTWYLASIACGAVLLL
ncbi:hypothetical protein ACHAP5_008292 [Fusarium lateritium]